MVSNGPLKLARRYSGPLEDEPQVGIDPISGEEDYYGPFAQAIRDLSGHLGFSTDKMAEFYFASYGSKMLFWDGLTDCVIGDIVDDCTEITPSQLEELEDCPGMGFRRIYGDVFYIAHDGPECRTPMYMVEDPQEVPFSMLKPRERLELESQLSYTPEILK